MPTRWEVTRALRASELPAAARLIVFVLADVADNDTATVSQSRTLSLSQLSTQTGLGRSTVARYLRLLETTGWIRRHQPTDAAKARAGEKTQYQLRVGASPAPGRGVVPGRDGGSPTAGRKSIPSKTPSKPPPYPPPAPPAPTPLDTLIAQVHRMRAEWQPDAIRRALTAALTPARTPVLVAEAARRCYADPATHSPGRLNTDGPWWGEAGEKLRATTRTALAGAPHCPHHRGQPAHNCGCCRGESLTHTRTG